MFRRIGIRQYVWRHPEWWTVAAALGAWVIVLTPHGLTPHGTPLLGTLCLTERPNTLASSFAALPSWIIMVVAMMLPLILMEVRLTAFKSLWCRRHRAIAGFLCGYLTVWLLASLPALVLDAVGVTGVVPLLAGLAIAVVWQTTPFKRRALLACRRTMPLAPNGWRADLACFRYGLFQGRSCLLNCWALMLLPLLAAHDTAIMVGVTVFLAAERYAPREVLSGPAIMALR
jgi:predicted metal-binding membrane protein